MLLTIAEIADILGVPRPAEAGGASGQLAARSVSGVTWDSRAVTPGCLYVALPGERVDGHDFVAQAAEAGAACALVSHPVEADVPQLAVEDTAAALTALAAAWRGRLSGTVLGLTGSTGKTTTKNLVRDVLGRAGSVTATLANQNNELGVPNTLLSADASTDFLVVEMGMRGAGQIAELCETAQPSWGLVTNVGESHIELLGSREAIAHAKAELLEALPAGGIAFVNAADDYAAELIAHARLAERGVRTVLFSGAAPLPEDRARERFASLGDAVSDAPRVYAEDVAIDAEGRAAFALCAEGFASIGRSQADGRVPCALQLRGLHNVSNACSAAAVGLAAGMTLARCAEALATAQPERGRQQVHRSAAGLTVVDDSYNANPDSMRASLSTFAAMDVAGRRIAVLGDMLELGDFSRECHERVGRMAATAGLGGLVCVGPLSRHTADAACAAGMPEDAVVCVDDAAAALAYLRPRVAAGDAVLVKASHSVGLDRVAEGLVD